MTLSLREGSRVFLDACCIINLFACDAIEQILAGLPFHFAVSRYVADREVIRVSTGETSRPTRLLKLDGLATSGHLTIQDLTSDDELTEFVRFASRLDDGEASICALAVIHQGAVATDDRKALRVLEEWTSSTTTLQTPNLIREWAQIHDISRRELRGVLRAIRDRARFVPHRRAPHHDWWMSHLE